MGLGVVYGGVFWLSLLENGGVFGLGLLEKKEQGVEAGCLPEKKVKWVFDGHGCWPEMEREKEGKWGSLGGDS